MIIFTPQTLISMLEKSRDYVSFLQKKLDRYLLGQGDQALGELNEEGIFLDIIFTACNRLPH